MKTTGEMYGKVVSSQLVKLYWDDLHRFGMEPISQAFRLHRQDEKVGKKFPLVLDILKRLRPDNRDTLTLRRCYQLDCKEIITHYMLDQNNVKRAFCIKHFDKYKPKTEIEKRVDDGAKQFSDEAKAFGLTNQQYFMKKFNITGNKNNVSAIMEAMKK
jgi:RecA-family ATPase